MKLKTLVLFAGVLFSGAAYSAQIVNVKYIHDYISKKHGISLPINASNNLQVANVKYLLCAVDAANSVYTGGKVKTSYCTNALATEQAVDTAATIDAVDRLISDTNCYRAGYYKSGANCLLCPANYYCPAGVTWRALCNGAGGYTSPAGSTAASDCVAVCTTAGYYKNGNTCAVCPQNYYCTSGTTTATYCGNGYMTNGTGNSASSACFATAIEGWITFPNYCTVERIDIDIGGYGTYHNYSVLSARLDWGDGTHTDVKGLANNNNGQNWISHTYSPTLNLGANQIFTNGRKFALYATTDCSSGSYGPIINRALLYCAGWDMPLETDSSTIRGTSYYCR